MILFAIIITVLVLPVIYNLLFPLKPPYLDNYFSPGQVFISKMEGVTQTIIKQEGDKVYVELKLSPGSVGPPEHLHLDFNENAALTKGTLTVKLDGETSKISAGSRIQFLKGHYHTFSNDTNEDVIITCEKPEDFVPVTFAYALSQFYPLFDSNSKIKMLHFFFKMSMFGDYFDSYVKEAPVNGQKTIKKILQPYARVLGYTLYDAKSKPR